LDPFAIVHFSPCAVARRPLQVALAVLALLVTASRECLRAQGGAPSAFVAHDVATYWNPPQDGRNQPQRIDLTLVVYFYDPEWHLLWAEAADGPSWFDNGGLPLPIQAGQRVRLEGTYVPAKGLDARTLHVAVRGETPLPMSVVVPSTVGEWESLNGHWVTIVGYVTHQQEYDATHVSYDVLCDGRVITTYLLLPSTDPVPQLASCRVKMSCVLVLNRGPSGQVQKIAAWVPRARDFTVTGSLDRDPLFSQPIMPIEHLASAKPGEWLRIAGDVHALEAGKSVTLRDPTGQVVIMTEQPLAANIGESVEVVGRVTGSGINATLAGPVCRAAPRSSTRATPLDGLPGEPIAKLRLADQVMELRPEQAEQHYPVALRGIVTWSDPQAGFFFLQDASGGIRVHYSPDRAKPPAVGSLLTVQGVSTNGPFAPEMDLHAIDLSASDVPPDPMPVTLEQALTGAVEAHRVVMRGYLRAVQRRGMWTQLNLTTATGEFTAFMSPDAETETLVGSMVRVTGVCTALTNPRRQLTGICLWLARPGAVAVEHPRASDPFQAAERSVSSLRQYLAVRMLDRQVRVTGMVLYDRPGRYLYLQQDDAGLMVLHRDTAPLRAGEWIEAVGIPGRDGNRLVLREALWRRTEAGPGPRAVAVNPAQIEPDYDGRLVTVQGRLQDRLGDGSGCRIVLRSGAARIEAHLDGTGTDAVPPEGSLVELTGVYALEYDEYRQPRSFRLLLRGPDDLHVLARASWWTAPHALAVASVFAACALFGVAWVLILRHRVREQTAQIRAQLEKETRMGAELERAARLESLGLLAGGIAHDFNNLLTIVMANLGLAALDQRVQAAAGPIIAEAERGARRAAELTQQLLTFAKGGDPVRRAVALPDVVREAAEFARHGSRVRCDYDFPPDLPPADVDRAQISRVVHNLVLNATQAMTEGGVIRLRLASVMLTPGEEVNLAAGAYVKLSVSDEGRGIDSAHLQRIFEPYFSTKPKNNGLGLATVHSIVKKHQGHIRVESRVGHGTTFHVWLPVASDAPVVPIAETAPVEGTAALRVLFMDDEEVIRRTASGILRQLGHEATVVGDGHEAIKAYEAQLRQGRRFDVVVLDLTVPGGLGGRAAMDVLRRMDPDVRAIVSSGYSNDPVLANYRAYGFSAVVPKPYEIRELARALHEVSLRRPPRASNPPHPVPA
jgi:signal transduction histidine kinase/ActR/RegA family two-component response regulator